MKRLLVRVLTGITAVSLPAAAWVLMGLSYVTGAVGILLAVLGVELCMLGIWLAKRTQVRLVEQIVVVLCVFVAAVHLILSLLGMFGGEEKWFHAAFVTLLIVNSYLYYRFLRIKDTDSGWWPAAREG